MVSVAVSHTTNTKLTLHQFDRPLGLNKYWTTRQCRLSQAWLSRINYSHNGSMLLIASLITPLLVTFILYARGNPLQDSRPPLPPQSSGFHIKHGIANGTILVEKA